MRALVNRIVVAAVLLALLTGAFFWLIHQDAAVQGDAVTLSAHEPTEILSVEVENARGGFRFYYDAEESGFVVDDIPSEYVDLDGFVAFMTRAGSVTALKCVNERPENPGVYGLDAPVAGAKIEYADGTALSLEFGAQDPVSGNWYARADGRPAVYLLEAERVEGFLASKRDYVTHAVTPALTVTSPLSAVRDVSISGGNLKQDVLIQSVAAGDDAVRQEAVSFGAVTHLVRGANTHELDQSYGIDILGSLLDIHALDVVGYNLDEAAYAARGFDAPYMTVRFNMADGAGYTLQLVEDGDGMLARVSDKNILFRIERPAIADVVYEKLILRWFLSPLLMDISGITVRWPGEVHEIAYSRASNAEQSAELDGKPLEIDRFQAFYRLLISACSDQAQLDAQPRGEPVLSVTYHYADRNKPDDTLRLYPGSARRLLAEVNGRCEFDMRETFAARVKEGVERLLSGGDIEEDW